MKRFHQQDVSMRAPSRRMWQRSFIILVLIALCFALVCGRLAILQLSEHEKWQTLASEQQLSDSVISDKRGTIYDRNGVVLAQSVEVATVIMMPSEIPDDAARQTICEELPPLLGINAEKLKKQTQKVGSRYEVVKSKIGNEERTAFIAWVKKHGFTGVFRVIQDYKREYPNGSTLSCVLGFTGTDNTGLEGLEAKYNTLLAGKAGRVITTKNGWGDAFPNDIQYETTVDAEEGESLYLTIDVTVQKIVEKYLEIAVAETGAANRATAIVMDVRTDEVLAMATKGDYDLNAPRVLQNPDTTAQIALLSGDEQSSALLTALQKQWKNKAVSEFYEPGSVFKIFTASAALQEGLISETSHFFCNGTYTMAGVRTMKCHVYPRSHGDQSLAEAISHSCNPAFMKIGSLLGTALFPRYHEAFGFTAPTGIDMLGEARVTASLYHTASAITAVDVATSSIGQTFKVTPIQMITGVCAVASDGNLRTPYVAARSVAADGTETVLNKPTVVRRVIAAETASRMCAMLEGVVDGGGAKNAYIAGYRVAGKTGTSEKTDQAAAANGRKNAVASFCGFAPANDPRVAVIVMIDEPQTQIRYGGTLAAPVAQKILADVLPHLGVQPQYTEDQLKTLQCTVPDVIGKTVSAAQTALTAAGLRYRVAGGGTVTAQTPSAGTLMQKDGTVVLYTEEQPTEQVNVPHTVGKPLSEANRLLTDAGLNVRIIGWTGEVGDRNTGGQAVVAEQSILENNTVDKGTVVEIRLIYTDAIE
ncbi:MAG: PASTA domain-containing protein [Clostridia bacterium]|nr:PASTA domain-containing protein [Clostridia bacterium]